MISQCENDGHDFDRREELERCDPARGSFRESYGSKGPRGDRNDYNERVLDENCDRDSGNRNQCRKKMTLSFCTSGRRKYASRGKFLPF